MASYLLYVKNANSTNAVSKLKQYGLSDLGFDNVMTTVVESAPDRSPDGGAICGWMKGSSDDAVMTYNSNQQWVPFPSNGSRGEGDVWIGFEPGRPVMPGDIARKSMNAGNSVCLADGNEWLIPAAQELPKKLGLGSGGEATLDVEPEFKEYYDKAFNAMQQVFKPFGMWNDSVGFAEDIEPTDEIKTVTIEDGARLAGIALSINYRLNYEVALLLGLLNERCLIGVIACTFDMPTIFDVDQQKKKKDVVSIPATSLT